MGQTLYQTPIMRKCWETGSFWYFQAVNSPKGLYNVFSEHIQRRFCFEHCNTRRFDQIVALYWSIDAMDIVDRKTKEEERYKNRLREAFATGMWKK